jgi:hypothetical protein
MSIEDDYPRLYEMYTESCDPDVIQQVCEIMKSLGAQDRHQSRALDRMIVFFGIKNIGKSLLQYEDVYLLCNDEVNAIIYPDPVLGKPYFRWVSGTGFRSQWPRTLKGLFELIDYSWGMSQVNELK